MYLNTQYIINELSQKKYIFDMLIDAGNFT